MIAAVHLLALTMWGECRQDTRCMRAVGHVVVNRVAAHDDRFGHDVAHAVWRKGQFGCWRGRNRAAMRTVASLPADNADAIAFAAARALAARILASRDPDPTRGATHFSRGRPTWSRAMTYRVSYAGSRFYQERHAA